MLLFLNVATDAWMLLALLFFLVFRLMLWCSPLVMSALCWISGRRKPGCAVKHIAITNILVLILNVIPFYLWYLTSGGWY